MQILVVDDNQMQSRLIRFLLLEAGHTVESAESGERALEWLSSFQPQLILMDLQLPGMDGLELTRRLRLDPAYQHTVVVALTAYTDPSGLQKAREAGCDGHIAKPIDASTFAHKVREFTRGIHADAPHDSYDPLAEARNNFLTEGLEQCIAMLKDLEAAPHCPIECMQRVIHRWAGIAATLGFKEIYEQARRIEEIVTQADPQKPRLKIAIESAQHRFSRATDSEPELPIAVIGGLAGVRVGLVDFLEGEAHRLRNVVERSGIEMVIKPVDSDCIEKQLEYDALIINDCADSKPDVLPPKLSVPAVFIGSRSSFGRISTLPSRAFDFLISPWDAEEVLLRVFRLIATPALSQGVADSAVRHRTRSRILIADDDPSIIALVSEVLRQFEMGCEIARSGRQALDAIRRRVPDAVVLDINMLDVDGFDVLRRIRRNLVTAKLPVLLLTGRSEQVDVARGFSDGANDYVVKPFKPLELANRVARLVASRAWHPLPAPRPVSPVSG